MDIEEIEQLVYEYGNDLYRFCYHLTSKGDMADELYQETFLRAVELKGKLDKCSNPKSYLMGVAVNVWKNMLRKKSRRSAIAPEVVFEYYGEGQGDDVKDLSEEYARKEAAGMVRSLVGELPEKQKLVVVLYYAEKMSTDEIGKLLHIPKGTVMSRLSKAREILRKGMEAKGYGI